MRHKIIAANWKMNLTHREARPYLDALLAELGELTPIEVVLIPPFTAIPALAEALTKSESVKLGAQNMHWAQQGAFTGEVSAAMLQDLGVSYVVLGHSERRALFAETDEVVNRKILSALDSGLCPIFCVGESLREREDNRVQAALEHQIRMGLDRVPPKSICEVVIAYEPVWAIGTGRTATPEQAQEAHAFIRSVIASVFEPSTAARVRIQYGGSVKPENAGELLRQEDIDGALVGGACLNPRVFAQIVHRAAAASVYTAPTK
jgi:triosephosphate isomerase